MFISQSSVYVACIVDFKDNALFFKNNKKIHLSDTLAL